MLVALLLRALPRRELDVRPAPPAAVLHEMAEVATSGRSARDRRLLRRLFLLLVRRRRLPADPAGRAPGLPASTAAIVTARVTVVNVAGNLARRLAAAARRAAGRASSSGATVSMAFCAAGIFLDGVPDLLRLVLAGVYSAVIGVVPGACSPRSRSMRRGRELVGAATGLLMQGSNFGALLGPPITAALVSAGRLARRRMADHRSRSGSSRLPASSCIGAKSVSLLHDLRRYRLRHDLPVVLHRQAPLRARARLRAGATTSPSPGGRSSSIPTCRPKA